MPTLISMHFKKRHIQILTLIVFAMCSALPPSLCAQTGTVADIDGNIYKTKKIGDQWWMIENLSVTRYNNGDSIPLLLNPDDWAATAAPACSYFNVSVSTMTYSFLI